MIKICYFYSEIMRQMPLGNFFEEQYHFAEMFNKLKLSDSEIGLLTAAMIVCPGKSFYRKELNNSNFS